MVGKLVHEIKKLFEEGKVIGKFKDKTGRTIAIEKGLNPDVYYVKINGQINLTGNAKEAKAYFLELEKKYK